MFQQIKNLVRHRAPESLYPTIAIPYYHLHPEYDSVTIKKARIGWRAKNIRRDTTLYYPVSQSAGRISKSGVEKEEIYQLAGQVEVEPSDTVVDVGAFVGEFSSAIAPTAARVLAVEPDLLSVRCLKRNTAQHPNVIVERALLDSTAEKKTLQLGTDPSENSLFGLDGGEERDAVTMNTETLYTVCKRHQIREIDFLKLEAEGAEPEILQGLDGIPVRKVAAGVGPERAGEPTRDRVAELLRERNFSILGEKENVLFARLD